MLTAMMQSLIILFIALAIAAFKRWRFEVERNRRREYYRNVYLKSDEWKRKRHVVLKRDNWRCTCCGEPATQVHHTRYAKKNIGKEPIGWLVSLCNSCHEAQHSKSQWTGNAPASQSVGTKFPVHCCVWYSRIPEMEIRARWKCIKWVQGLISG